MPGSSWRGGQPGVPRKPSPQGYRWNREPDAAEVVRPRSRRGRFLRALAALVACLAAIVALVLLFRQGRPPLLALVGAGYAENLDVPHNAWGLNALDRLSGLGKATNGIRALFDGGAYAPHAGPKGSPWLLGDPDGDGTRAWVEHAAALKRRAKAHKGPLILVMALHGSADAGGPFLLAEQARPGSSPLRVQAVLETLAAIDGKWPKLLVLDPTAMGEAPEFAGPGDDFARELERLAIPKGKNIWVLCSSAAGQRSWVDEASGMSAFGRVLAQGLEGKAKTKGGNLTLASLCDYVGRETSAWSAAERGALQTPTLACDLGVARLPDWVGPKGKAIREAAGVELVRSIVPPRAAEGQAERARVAPAEAAAGARLAAAWNGAEGLEVRKDGKAGEPGRVLRTPASYAPAAWRRLRESLVRREQLLLHGYDALVARGALGLAAPKALDADLDALPGQIAEAGTVPLKRSRDLSLAMRAAEGVARPAADAAAQSAWLLLDEADEAGLEKALKAAGPLAAGVAGLALSRLADEADFDAIDKAADRLGRAFPANAPAPAEVRLLKLLRDGLASSTGRPRGDLLARALRVRRRAERLAAGAVDPPAYPHAEAVLPWVRDDLDAGDRDRRSAEDLLLSTRPEDHSEAEALFGSAEAAFDRAAARAESIRTALNRRDTARADLPFYARWAAGRPLGWGPVDEVVGLWDAVRALGELLERGPAADLVALEAASAAVGKGYVAIADAFNEVVNGPSRDRLLDPLAMAEARGVPAPYRGQFRPERAQAKAPRPPIDPVADAAADRERRRIRAVLALAAVSDDLFLRANNLDSSRFREGLRPGVEPAALASTLKALGPLIRHVLNWLPGHVDTLAATVPPLDAPMGPSTAQDLTLAARLAPLLGPTRARSLATDPVGLARRRRLYDLLVHQAERAWADHDWSVDKPVYDEVAGLYLADARELGKGLIGSAATKAAQQAVEAKVGARDAALTAVDTLELTPSPARPAWTSEREFPMAYRLDAGPTPGAPPVQGRPVAWVDGPADGLFATVGPPKARTALRLGGPEPDRTLSALLRSDLHDAREHALPPGPERRAADVASTLLFRGRRVERPTPVEVYLRAERTHRADPGPEDAGLLVRADEEFGGPDAALAIVFDNSLSMNYFASGEKASKYQVAVESLRDVLNAVPLKDKTWVGLWTYGVEGPPGGPVGSTDEARKAHSDDFWSPATSPGRLMGRLTLEAGTNRPPVGFWNATPLVTSMRAALAGLKGSGRARKQMVVLTDGADSFPKLHNDVRSVILDEFGGQGVVVHVLFFATDVEANIAKIDTLVGPAADPAERRKRRDEYLTILKELAASDKDVPKSLGAVAEISPKGTFTTATRRQELVDGLADSLASRPRYGVADRAGHAVPARARDRYVLPREAGPGDAERLPPGDYLVSVGDATAWVRLAPGPTLILDLQAAGGKPALRRGLLSDGPATVDRVEAAGWRLATARGDTRPGSGFEAILEDVGRREVHAVGGSPVVEQYAPKAAWLEVVAADLPARALELRSLVGRAAPSWGIALSGPPPEGAKLRAWFREDAGMPTVSVPRAKLEPGATIDGSGTVLEYIGIEPHEVADAADGQRAPADCLTIRLRHAPGRRLMVDRIDLSGIPAARSEQRFYPAAGRVTALYWPATREQLAGLRAIHLADVDAFLADPRTKSLEIKLDPRLVR